MSNTNFLFQSFHYTQLYKNHMVHIITREEYHSQKKVDVYGKEDCPLCDGADFDPDLLITETKYWRIFHAKSPYS